MSETLITTPRGQMPGWLAEPAGEDKLPGVVVLHDVGGMTADTHFQCAWLAEAGFLALAPNLFFHGGFITCLREIMRDLPARTGPSFDSVEAARSRLLAHPRCNGKVGVIGFCMGGGFALLLVSGRGFSASAVNYGGKPSKDFENFLDTACPVVASYGGTARWEQGAADQLRLLLDRALVPNDCKEYPGCGHGFMTHHQDFLYHLMQWTGMAYNEEATMDARRRIVGFFRTHLAAAEPQP